MKYLPAALMGITGLQIQLCKLIYNLPQKECGELASMAFTAAFFLVVCVELRDKGQ